MSNSNLADQFDVEDVRKEIKTFKEIFNEVKEIPNPDQTMAAAIEKAAIILDLIHEEMENDGMSARYAEVAAQLINTILQSSSLIGNTLQTKIENTFKDRALDQKDKEIDIKAEEARIKEMYYTNKKQIEGGQNQNIIVTDTKSILKFLEDKNKE